MLLHMIVPPPNPPEILRVKTHANPIHYHATLSIKIDAEKVSTRRCAVRGPSAKAHRTMRSGNHIIFFCSEQEGTKKKNMHNVNKRF